MKSAKEIKELFQAACIDELPELIKDYKEASCILGRNIKILSGEHAGAAYALDIDERARLVVKKGDATITLDSGDVSISFTEQNGQV